jgi:hypothetical protein
MEAMTYLPLALIAAVVIVPLAREYADFRRTWGLGAVASLATTLLVLPALGVGLAIGVRLDTSFEVQWAATVVVTLAVYSLAAAGVRNAVEPARSPRRSV